MPRPLAFLSTLAAAALALPLPQQEKRVSRPMLPGRASSSAAVVAFQTAPGRARVLYWPNPSSAVGEPGSVLLSDGSTQRIRGPSSLVLPAHGERFLYSSSTYNDWTGHVVSLYSAPIDGSAGPLLIDELAGLDSGAHRKVLSPDGAWVAWAADQLVDSIYAVPTDGSAPSHAVASLPGSTIEELVFTADSSRVLYRGLRSLSSVPVSGLSSSVRLDGLSSAFSGLASFQQSPDGTRVVYRADQEANERYELYSRAADGSGPLVKLNATPVSGGSVEEYRISPDGTFVVYRADALVDGRHELFRVPIGGGAAPILLSGTLPAPADVRPDFAISADSQTVVFRADAQEDERFELHGVRADGSAPPRVLNAALVPGSDVLDFLLPPQGLRLAYRADGEQPGRIELYSAPLDGSALAVKLSASPLAEADVQADYRFGPSGGIVFYRQDRDVDETFQLLARLASGASAAQVLNGPLVAGGDVEPGFDASFGGGRVVYRADELVDGRTELWRTQPGSARVRLSRDLTLGTPTGDVSVYSPAEGGARAVYLADRERDGVFELHGCALDDRPEHRKLSPPLPASADVLSATTTPDGKWTLFTANHVQSAVHLFSVPSDGRAPAVRLSPDFLGAPPHRGVSAAKGSADGSRVFFLADPHVSGQNELFSAPVDGSAAAIPLNPPLPAGVQVVESDAGPTRIAFSTWIAKGIWSATHDGASPPILLASGLTQLPVLRLSPDETRVVFVADLLVAGRLDVYSVPTDGSTAPVLLNGPLVPGGSVESDGFAITADSSRVVYRADANLLGVEELFRVSIDGSAAPVPLSAPGATTSITDFVLSPDSSRALFRLDLRLEELYSVPVAGGQAPAYLHAGVHSTDRRRGYWIEPDSAHVLITAPRDDGRYQLWRAPVDASLPPLALGEPFTHGPLSGPASTNDVAVSPDGGWAAYIATVQSSQSELFLVDLDTLAVTRVHPGAGSIGSFAFTSDSRRLLYRGDPGATGVQELFQHVLERPLWRKR